MNEHRGNVSVFVIFDLLAGFNMADHDIVGQQEWTSWHLTGLNPIWRIWLPPFDQLYSLLYDTSTKYTPQINQSLDATNHFRVENNETNPF